MGAGAGERKHPAKENAACQVRLCTNIRYERVAPGGGDSLRPGRHLSDPRPLLCFLISVSPSLFSSIHSATLFLFVQREGGQAAILFLPAVATKCFVKSETKYECPLC